MREQRELIIRSYQTERELDGEKEFDETASLAQPLLATAGWVKVSMYSARSVASRLSAHGADRPVA